MVGSVESARLKLTTVVALIEFKYAKNIDQSAPYSS
jgi:hypothetical protein